jgi:hypothetical protein
MHLRFLLLMALLCSCVGPSLGGDDDDSAAGEEGPGTLDLLIIVDNSQSTASIQLDLASSLPPRLAAMADEGWSIHVGVTTTDLDATGTGNAGNLRSFDVLGTGSCSDGLVLDASSDTFETSLASLLDVGINGSGQEYGALAALAALCKAGDEEFWDDLDAGNLGAELPQVCNPMVQGAGCNAGLLRDGAERAVLLITDEGDATAANTSLPGAAWLGACSDGECDCRVNFFASALGALDARYFVLGPSYQSTGAQTAWCDGSTRDIPGPCNHFNSASCSIDMQQELACATGGEWWPSSTTTTTALECTDADLDAVFLELAGAL